ncbi:MAG: EAL domain-containing protein, partial [Clostridia bacterium]|nr:EAL domain-containing protein [Clostridia bacterium]
ILSDIISMISKLGVHTLAEGVQTKEQLRFLRDAGCDKVQGYLFSRPMPCEYFYNKTVLYNGLHYDDVERSDYFSKIETTGLGFPAIPDLQEGFSGDASGTPSAVMEIHDGKCKVLKANNAYKKFLSDIGISDDVIYGDYYEWERRPVPEFLKAVDECIGTKKSVHLSGVVEGGMKIDLQLVNVAYDEKTKTGAVLVLIIKYEPEK